MAPGDVSATYGEDANVFASSPNRTERFAEPTQERLRHRKVRPYITEGGSLYSYLEPRLEQIAFHSGHSTTMQLIRILHLMSSEFNCGKYAIVVFLAMKKTFDRVGREGLDWEEDITTFRQIHLAAINMQQMFNQLPAWLEKWKMTVQVRKTSVILTGRQRTIPSYASGIKMWSEKTLLDI
ncbi:hypothetical protein EVAR_57160_1 [Eumeta japonica]|uniref:Reverse transcriptase domain-containing protein n=1 Tax=Eumeta variegata TaxID=151549 RepID=A0A4C1YUK9_EUMVA|nr:hypothetical protein EVAR_57160_1 [Eumeta japonica]